MYIYIYIEREREREKERVAYTQNHVFCLFANAGW